jgi:hypothetical protein
LVFVLRPWFGVFRRGDGRGLVCFVVGFGWFGGVVLPRPVRAAGSGVARLFAVIVQGGRGVWGGGQSL